MQPSITVDGDRARARWQLLSPCVTSTGEATWVCGHEDDEYVRSGSRTWLHERITLRTRSSSPRPAPTGADLADSPSGSTSNVAD